MRFQPRLLRRGAPTVLALAVATLLAGCSGSDPAGERGEDSPGDGAATAPTSSDGRAIEGAGRLEAAARKPPVEAGPADGATVGGDGSAIELSPLTAEDVDSAVLPGELGCSFSTQDTALLLAKGDVASDEPGRGVVKVGSYVEPVAAPGGFDAMLAGATFTGAGKTVRIDVTGPAIGGGESPPRAATLTYDRADGARRSYAGQWQCGP